MKKNLEKTDIYAITTALILAVVLITLMLAKAPVEIIGIGFLLSPVYGIVVYLLLHNKLK